MDSDTIRKNRYLRFVSKLFEMVDEPSTDSTVSWSETGNSFIIWNESDFVKNVLPLYLPFKEMPPFSRRLQKMGFKKIIESQNCEFASKYFVRGHPEIEPPPEAFEYVRPSEAVCEQVSQRLKDMAADLNKRKAKREAREAAHKAKETK